MKYMAQHIGTTLSEVPLNEYLMLSVVFESRLDFTSLLPCFEPAQYKGIC